MSPDGSDSLLPTPDHERCGPIILYGRTAIHTYIRLGWQKKKQKRAAKKKDKRGNNMYCKIGVADKRGKKCLPNKTFKEGDESIRNTDKEKVRKKQ